MKLPHRIKIKPRVSYQIVWVDRFDDKDIRGMCDFDKKLIMLWKGLTPKGIVVTFIHEVCHCIEFEHKVKFPHPLIYVLEEAVYWLLKSNGWLPKKGSLVR